MATLCIATLMGRGLHPENHVVLLKTYQNNWNVEGLLLECDFRKARCTVWMATYIH